METGSSGRRRSRGWRSILPGEAPLPPTMLEGSAQEVARRLLGCHLLSFVGGGVTGGRIVETEAYVGMDDPACHAATKVGRTARNAAMYGAAGTAYVYFIYGMHWCFNVVTGRQGDPQAVLVRAIEAGIGRGTMAARRAGRAKDLVNGPARLCQALGIDGALNEHPLSLPPLVLLTGARPDDDEVGVSGRVGIREARDWPLRFYLKGHPDVSPVSPSSFVRISPSS